MADFQELPQFAVRLFPRTKLLRDPLSSKTMSILNRTIGLCFCATIVSISSPTMAFAQEIGFSERFALAENRDAALAELIPGTDSYFYYHCLHCQTIGKIAEARGHLDAWIAKVGLNEQTQRMQTRQFLLEYRTNPQATFDHLRSNFGINIDHPAPRKDEAAELETKLDPNVLNWSAIVKSHANNPGAIENVALASIASNLDQPNNLRNWLQRIDRVDAPGLLELIVRELNMPDSRGFGWAPIHLRMTTQQILDLQKQIPKLIESNAFVQARLRRIRPDDDSSLEDRSVLRNHLTALETFVSGLPESQNSLIASVLYNRLQFDEQDGTMDRERFLRYIKLPSNRPFFNQEFVARQNARPQVNLGANYKGETLLEAIGDDSSLVHRYLEHFFKTDANVDAFSAILDRDYLRRVFASTKIHYGLGDAKAYYAQLSPDEQRELQSRIELKFALSNPTHYKPSDTVRLTLDLKNVPELLVKVYRLNARNILMQQKQPIGTNLDLDGLVANIEKRFTYAQAADIRHREVLEMPELDGGGVWVVDVLARGQRSRTLIHKGHLNAIQRMTDAGDTFRVYDAEGKHLPKAKALFGNREFEADDQGDIVIPFGRELRTDSLVFIDGPIASVQLFVHNTENYQLQAGFLLDPQSLLAGAKANVVIRPNLLCNGQMVSLSQLEKPMLTITSTDLDGIDATQTIPDLKLADNGELVHSFLVPQRLANIAITLSGQVLKLSNDSRIPVSASHAVAINGMARTAQVRDFFLTQTDKGYSLEVRGRNGESAARVPVQFEFKLFGIVPTVGVRLATDENGLIDLGSLPSVERFKSTADSMVPRDFVLVNSLPTWPEKYHTLSGEPIDLVWHNIDGSQQGPQKLGANDKLISRLSLIEFRGGVDVASHVDKVSIESGLVKIKGLAPGTYRLTDHWSGSSTQISVVKGERQGNVLIGQSRILETNRVRAVHVREVKLVDEKLQVQLGNFDEFTRIHVVADAYEPRVHSGLNLSAPSFPMSSLDRSRVPSFYINSLKLDEEYQYVLQRQLIKKYLGSLLPQPSAILNPWELSVTQKASQTAATGDPMAAMAPKMAAPNSARDRDEQLARIAAELTPEYEFLKRGCIMLTNGRCDAKGMLSIDRKTFAGLTSVTVIVVHPSGTTYRTIHLPLAEPRSLADRRLANAFQDKDHFVEVQSVRVLPKSGKNDLGDAASTRVKIYSSIPDVFQLYRTLLNNNAACDKFECLTRWSALKDAEKERHYSELACHELNLFLLIHDKPFFDRVVSPLLANKMQKQFMDDYVLETDLSKYVQPWRLAQLNAVERVLLAKRIADQSGRTKRWMGDLVSSVPIDSVAQSVRFAKGLMSVALGDVEGFGNIDGRVNLNSLSLERRQLSEMSAGAMGGMGMASGQADQPADAFFFDALAEAEGLAKGKADGEDKAGAATLGRAMSKKRMAGGGAGGPGGSGRPGRLYESLESTRKWAESNYFRLPLANQKAELVRSNAFWLDYLNHAGDAPFVSKNIELASSNIHEALLAMAVLSLPLESKPATLSVEQGRLIAATTTDSIAFVQGLQTSELSTDPATVLASQSIFLASDTGEEAKPVKEQSLIKGTVYRLRVVLTNPSASMMRVNVLQQIPQGAIALENAKVVAGQKLDLAPFATQELNTKFYFPQSGTFEHYGAQIALNTKIAIASPSTTIKVLDAPDSVDETSWSYVAAWGTDEQVLAHLKSANLFKINLDAIAWRMANRKFFETCLARLTEYGTYHSNLWAYSIKHNDAPRLREFLESNSAIVGRVGPLFASETMNVEPVDRLQFEHLDFRPLVVARMHQLGPKRVILNDGLAVQYERMMGILAHQKTIESEQRLALVYYMLLQNRIEDAIAHFAKIDAGTLESKMQYDYFASYLDMLQGRFEEAELRSQKYANTPNPRWRDWFAQVRSQVSERKAIQAGKTADIANAEDWQTDPANRLLSGARELQNTKEAASLPSLDLIQDGDKIVLRHRNLEAVTVKYYLMDVELLFSRNPFAQQDGGRLSMIEPNLAEVVKVEASTALKDANLAIPVSLKNKNLVIEVSGGGLMKNLVLYANSLVLNHSPNMGRLQILTKQGLQPLEGAYVKVYAKDNSGAVKFYKDGYTDLRGQFDYTSLSTKDLDTTQRFSLLVLHPEHGTVVRESEPPKR